MRQVKAVLRLTWACGLSARQIAPSLRISRPTVADDVRRAKDAGLSWPLPADLGDDVLERRLFARTVKQPPAQRPMPDGSRVHRELQRTGVTRVLLWQEYQAATPEGLQYSQFCEAYRTWAPRLDRVMRHRHRAGEPLCVDYAGQPMPVVEPHTGERRDASLFIAVLGAAHSPYAEAPGSQSRPDGMGSHVRAFAALGGVPPVLVPENLPAAVNRPHRYEPALHRTSLDMAQHYGVAIVPARAGRPRDTAQVAGGVQVVERWILARLRDHTCFALGALNPASTARRPALNPRPLKTLPGSRLSLFASLDRPALRPLPDSPYPYAEWTLVRGTIDYPVAGAGHSSSVPYALGKPQRAARISDPTVALFHQGKRVASHRRAPHQGRHTPT